VAHWFGADHEALFHDFADIGYLALVAVERAVALVPIFEAGAICVGEALAVHGFPHALALAAVIAKGADVTIVAVPRGGLVVAAAAFGAEIFGAGVVVVAVYRFADADSRFAVVSNGAGIAVQAFAFGEGHSLAAICTETGVFGARIFVVAEAYVVIFDEGRFVDVAVAVVVDPVAGFCGGLGCVASSQPFGCADPLARAGS